MPKVCTNCGQEKSIVKEVTNRQGVKASWCAECFDDINGSHDSRIDVNASPLSLDDLYEY